MKEKFTLFELLSNEEREFYLTKTLKIYTILSSYLKDWLIDDNEEYFIDEIPYHLLKKEVISAFYYDNTVEIFVK